MCAVPLYFDERLRRRVTSHNRVFLLVLIHAWVNILDDPLAGEYYLLEALVAC